MRGIIPILLMFFTCAISIKCVKEKEKKEPTIHCENLIDDGFVFDGWYHDYGSNYLYIPNAFSPNGDGLNDGFFPITSLNDTTTLLWKFIIYDINSDIVWQSNDYMNSRWHPVLVTEGKYFYRLEIMTRDSIRVGRCGEVYAIRICYPKDMNLIFHDQYQEISSSGELHPSMESSCE